MNFRMQSFDAPVHHFGKTRDFGNFRHMLNQLSRRDLAAVPPVADNFGRRNLLNSLANPTIPALSETLNRARLIFRNSLIIINVLFFSFWKDFVNLIFDLPSKKIVIK